VNITHICELSGLTRFFIVFHLNAYYTFSSQKGFILNFQRYARLFLIISFGFVLLIAIIQCGKTDAPDGPVFLIRNPQLLVKNIASNYITVPRFDSDAETVIFNGRLDGDLWDCIYTIPARGGEYQKIQEDTEDLLFPSFSSDQTKIIYSRGLTRQITLYDIETEQQTALPIFGNTPILLPDNVTVLYTGVLDANLKLYHLPSHQSRNVTESFISANFSPVLLTDMLTLRWIEKLKNGQHRIDQTSLDTLKTQVIHTIPDPIVAITSSPGGRWLLANQPNGALIGINPADSLTARVEIRSDTDDNILSMLISQPDWASNGNKLLYASVPQDRLSTQNPFFKRGYYVADLMIAGLKWEKIDDGDIFRSLRPRQLDLFPLSETRQTAAKARPAELNNPPKIVSDPPESVFQGDVYIYRVQSVEIDLFDALEYHLLSGPAAAEMLPKSGILYWVPSDTGNYDFNVAVSDEKGARDVQSFVVNVPANPDWSQRDLTYPERPPVKGEYIAGLVFKDPNNDGLLSAGEEAQILIDLKTRSTEMDSVILQLITTTRSGEIEMENEIIFEHCSTDQWSRKIIPIRGLAGLRNRPIVIRGILQNDTGIDVLPASLVISAHNPNPPQY